MRAFCSDISLMNWRRAFFWYIFKVHAWHINRKNDLYIWDDYYLFSFFSRDKVAFVTGGASGICFTIAEVLMRYCYIDTDNVYL